jgi:hypothetical protein
MAHLSVTCFECGLCGELNHSGQDFDDPEGKCKYHLRPLECPALRAPLIGAVHILDLMEWDVVLANEDAVGRPLEPRPSEGAIILKPGVTESPHIIKRGAVEGRATDHKLG